MKPRETENSAKPEELFVLIIEDRHIDTDVRVFSDADVALEAAKVLVEEYGRAEDVSEELNVAMREDGWIYHAVYSCEGDNVRVVKRVLDLA